MKTKQINVRDVVDSFERRYSLGFTTLEVNIIVTNYFPDMSWERYSDAMSGKTIAKENTDAVYYPWDVIRAIEYALSE